MRTYDLVLVLRSSLSDKDRTKTVDAIKSDFSDVAKVAKETDMGQKPLAYKIKKEAAGHYVRLELESEKGISPEFEKSLFREESILRHLLIRTK